MMVRVPSHREPTHPGETLLEVFLVPMGASQRELADAIHVPYQWINELVNVRRGVTSSTAFRFARFPYNTIYWEGWPSRRIPTRTMPSDIGLGCWCC